MGKGRGNGTSITVKEAVRLSINQMVKDKLIRYKATITYSTKWTSGASIQIKTVYNEIDKYITLSYFYNKKPIEYNIKLAEVKSNLGKGVILYFICPETARRCKILYCCYSSEIFKSRTAYRNRIYYYDQVISKAFLTPARHNRVDKIVNEMYQKRATKFYKGKDTKRHLRLLRLFKKRSYLEEKKDIELDQYLSKFLGYSISVIFYYLY